MYRKKIVFKKREVGYKSSYTIERPEFQDKNKTTLLIFGGHGHGFQIVYSDSAIIYYTNDPATTTPNYHNYRTEGWKSFGVSNQAGDTVLAGQQPGGHYWKEIIKGEDYLGYLNVSQEDQPLFDRALETFRK